MALLLSALLPRTGCSGWGGTATGHSSGAPDFWWGAAWLPGGGAAGTQQTRAFVACAQACPAWHGSLPVAPS